MRLPREVAELRPRLVRDAIWRVGAAEREGAALLRAAERGAEREAVERVVAAGRIAAWRLEADREELEDWALVLASVRAEASTGKRAAIKHRPSRPPISFRMDPPIPLLTRTSLATNTTPARDRRDTYYGVLRQGR